MFKKFICIIFACFFSLHFIYAYDSLGAPTGYINDFANILTVDQRQTLEQKITNFERQTQHEISVVTIKSLAGDTIENFAVKLFEEWKIGKDTYDNGVLLLIAMDDRRMRIEVGYGLEPVLTDALSNYIIQNVLKPHFQNAEYYVGISEALDAITKSIAGEYVPIASSSSIDLTEDEDNDDYLPVVFFLCYLYFFSLILFSALALPGWSMFVGAIIASLIGLIFGSMIIAGVLIIVFIFISFLMGLFAKGVGSGGAGSYSTSNSSEFSTTDIFHSSSSSKSDSSDSFSGFGGGSSGGGGASGSW